MLVAEQYQCSPGYRGSVGRAGSPRALMTGSPQRSPEASAKRLGRPLGAYWVFLLSCCSLIPPCAWVLEEVVSTSSSPTPFSVPPSGANWWGKGGWSRQQKQLDWSGSPLFLPAALSWPFYSVTLRQRMQGSSLSWSAPSLGPQK